MGWAVSEFIVSSLDTRSICVMGIKSRQALKGTLAIRCAALIGQFTKRTDGLAGAACASVHCQFFDQRMGHRPYTIA